MGRSSRPGSSQSTAAAATDVRAAPAQAQNVVLDSGLFNLPTGDTYEGFFEAKRKERSVKMHGPGVYRTAQGDTYSGTWENDALAPLKVATATFPDGAKYEGAVSDSSYCGPGSYLYPDGSELIGHFERNCPVGELTLVDPNGHRWLGSAERGFAWMGPVNHYYDVLEREGKDGRGRKNAN